MAMMPQRCTALTNGANTDAAPALKDATKRGCTLGSRRNAAPAAMPSVAPSSTSRPPSKERSFGTRPSQSGWMSCRTKSMTPTSWLPRRSHSPVECWLTSASCLLRCRSKLASATLFLYTNGRKTTASHDGTCLSPVNRQTRITAAKPKAGSISPRIASASTPRATGSHCTTRPCCASSAGTSSSAPLSGGMTRSSPRAQPSSSSAEALA
mmetsp:Transcript_67107/g.216459  ORF Transcript_67107/g.216459 Transcript_67107/m.216459 type:complete len:210 (+) Transcript_67107:624-1253(+)